MTACLQASRPVRAGPVDADDKHVYQPGPLFVPFGLARPEALVRSRRHQLRAGVEFHSSAADHVDLQNDTALLADGTSLGYDVLVVATGARLMPEETDGLLGPGWLEKVFTFYSLDGAAALQSALARFDGGRLVVGVMDMPIKCPVVPLEFCFLADWYFTKRGIRDKVELTFATPLDGGHQGHVQPRAQRPAHEQGDQPGHRIQHRRGGRPRTPLPVTVDRTGRGRRCRCGLPSPQPAEQASR